MKSIFLLLCSAGAASAISFTGTQTAPNTWSYDLTFDPFDNYSVCQPNTTITLAGLGHVTAVAAPTGTDLPGTYFDEVNTNWVPEILAGGLGARWTHVGSGTGNWGVPRYVYGFRVFSTAISTGSVYLATSGVALDAPCQSTNNRDILTTISGPVETNLLQVGVSLDLFPAPAGRSLTIVGPTGHDCRLQVSDSIPTTNWVDLYSFTLLSQITNLVDTTAPNSTTRFYRVVSP